MPQKKENVEFWAKVKLLAQQNLKPGAYDYFIEPAKLWDIENDVAKIVVESSLHKGFWESQTDLITAAGFEIFGRPIDYQLFSSDELDEFPESSSSNLTEIREPNATFVTANSAPEITGINPEYTFETFIQGPGSKFTYAAAVAVSDNPGKLYNPLFIHGGPGLGKTHLMHAIGNEILKDNPNARVKYVSAEGFVSAYVDASRNKTFEAFENTYRNLDLLLLDDIQFFKEQTGTIQEFFETFNILHSKDAQIVVVSDRPPEELNNLEERLISRFSWGLTTDITAPDYETRMAILLNKAEYSEVNFPTETLSYIAGQIDSNVRALEGALNRVEFVAKTNNVQNVDIDTASEALKTLKKSAAQTASNLTVDKIQDIVAKAYQVTANDLKGSKRNKEITTARQIAMYLSREMLALSLPAIGASFGGKDHTTVIYANKQISEKLKNDVELQKTIDDIKRKLNA